MNHAGEATPDGFPVDTLTSMGDLGEIGRATPALRSLAIVGSHPDTRENAPFDDPNFEIWLFNEAPQKPEIYKRWDACLQIHLPEVYTSTENWINKDHWEWLQQDHGDRRIFMQEVDPRVPNSVKYPLEEILSLVPYKYLRSSPAMALALGIYLGYKHIELYGSELSSNTEYFYQAINYGFWIGVAVGRGVDLRMECWHQEFYKQPIYGYEGELQIDKDFFYERFVECEIIWKAKDKAYQKLQKKLDKALMEAKFDKVGELSLALENAAINTGEVWAGMKEAKRYHERTDPISRQEFERVCAQAQLDGEGVEKMMNHEAGKCEYVWNIWRQTGNYEALKQLRTFLGKKTDLAFDMGTKLGVFRENMLYRDEYDRRVQSAGGKRAIHFEGRKTEVQAESSDVRVGLRYGKVEAANE
jgi:hypothetical protein